MPQSRVYLAGVLSAGGSVSGVNLGFGAKVLKAVAAPILYFRTIISSKNLQVDELTDEIDINLKSRDTYQTFSLVTTSTSYENAYSFNLLPNKTYRIFYSVLSRNSTNQHKSYFERSYLLFHNGTQAEIVSFESKSSLKSDKTLETRLWTSLSQAIIQVRSNTVDTTQWAGDIRIIELP